MTVLSLLQFTNPLVEIGFRFTINVVIISILVRGIYFFVRKEEEYAFTFYLFNVLIFFVCYLMQAVEISIGFGFGLFAIFGILRYRTDTIPIKEMTYLFTAISIALINAIAPLDFVMAFMNLSILLFVFVMEKTWFSKKESSTSIQYEKLDLLGHGKEVVLQDLRERTNLNVTRYKVKSYNFINDSASLKIYYLPHE